MKASVLISGLFLMVSLSANAAFSSGDLFCKGTNVEVVLSQYLDTFTVNGITHRITNVTSETGDIDWTYHTNDQVSLTLDDQYGDSLKIKSESYPLVCQRKN